MIPSSKSVSHSRTWTFFKGEWHEGNAPIMGPRTHGLWLGSTVFDGARARIRHDQADFVARAAEAAVGSAPAPFEPFVSPRTPSSRRTPGTVFER